MTYLNELGLSIIGLLVISIILLPRRYAFLPLLVAVCYLTLGQTVILAGANFHPVRILTLMGFVGLFFRMDHPKINFNRIDCLVILWAVSSFTIYMIREPDTISLIYRLGFLYDAVGLYFLSRFLIADLDDIRTVTKYACIIIVPMAIFMIIESSTGNNVFSYFGAVKEISLTRDGSVRSQGPFRHPILAGSFCASLIPLFLACWWQENGKIYASIGVLFATVVVMTTQSSGPMLSFVAAVVVFSFWTIRDHVSKLAWVALFAIVFLDVIMEAPFYYIIDRISDLIGGSGWYRSYLIQQAIERFDEWWLIGVSDTSKWMPFAIPGRVDFADITNQYIAEGVTGGLITMILFILVITFCFKSIGRNIQSSHELPLSDQMIYWSLGVSLTVHCVSFFSVSYFDQIIVIWYFLLASISSLDSSSHTSHQGEAFDSLPQNGNQGDFK